MKNLFFTILATLLISASVKAQSITIQNNTNCPHAVDVYIAPIPACFGSALATTVNVAVGGANTYTAPAGFWVVGVDITSYGLQLSNPTLGSACSGFPPSGVGIPSPCWNTHGLTTFTQGMTGSLVIN